MGVPVRITFANGIFTARQGRYHTFTVGQWTANGSPISGQTALTYTPTPDVAGQVIGFTPTNPVPTSNTITLPVVAPSPITGLTLTAGANSVSAAFNMPTYSGGQPVNRIDILLSNGQAGFGTSSPIVIPTPNGIPVTAIGFATSGFGTNTPLSSLASQPSNSVTPSTSGVTNNVFAGSRIQTPTNTVNIPSGFACQRPHVNTTGGTLSNIVFTDVWWYINDSFGITTIADTVSFKKFLEYPRGTFTLATYNSGAVNYTMSPTNTQQDSDAVSAVSVPNGAAYWEHTLIVTGSAVDVPCLELPAGSSVIGTLDAKYAFTANAPASQTVGTTSVNYFGSAVIRGTVNAANVKSVFMSGDSVLFGQGDVTSAGAAGSSGYLPRWADRASVGYAKFAKMGMSAFDLKNALTASPAILNPYFALIANCCSHHLTEWGTNDLRLGQTQAQLTANIGIIQATTPGKVYGQSTLLNRTTSTDGWVTTANQTVQTDGNWGALTAFNTAVRALLPNTTFFAESSDFASTARNSGIWPAPGGVAQTLDGTHPVSAMANTIATGMTFTLP